MAIDVYALVSEMMHITFYQKLDVEDLEDQKEIVEPCPVTKEDKLNSFWREYQRETS